MKYREKVIHKKYLLWQFDRAFLFYVIYVAAFVHDWMIVFFLQIKRKLKFVLIENTKTENGHIQQALFSAICTGKRLSGVLQLLYIIKLVAILKYKQN